jgi:hypothetical protein
MTAYVDDAAILYRGKKRYHLTADSVAELHKFAKEASIASCWWHRGARHPHYDITEAERNEVLARGAKPVDQRAFVRIALRAAGKPTP